MSVLLSQHDVIARCFGSIDVLPPGTARAPGAKFGSRSRNRQFTSPARDTADCYIDIRNDPG